MTISFALSNEMIEPIKLTNHHTWPDRINRMLSMLDVIGFRVVVSDDDREDMNFYFRAQSA